jgi:hypothetical protein
VTAKSEDSVEVLENPNLGELNCRISLTRMKDAEGGMIDVEKEDLKGAADFDALAVDDSEAVENMVPTRAFLKMSSGRQAGEARRQAEATEKRAKMQARLEAADEKERAALTSTAALQKAQAIANSRLAKHHHPVGLPKSLKISDDPMVKANVFMTEMPQLD